MVYNDIKRHGPMKKAIRQMSSTRVSGFVAITEYAKYCISENGKDFNN